jgi:ASPIC/UnbV protein/VCBS repeat protein
MTRRLGLSMTALWLLSLFGAASGSDGRLRFQEVGAEAGVRHVHHTRAFSGPHADVLGIFTSGGAAVAVADYDGDGLDDLFVTDSAVNGRGRLYHNDGGMHFTDVTDRAGLADANTPNAIVADALWFDYDNDGWRDLLIVRFGTPILYHNDGGGHFTDVTARSGLTKFANTIAAIAFDYDKDGRLDLLFGNYFQPVNLLDLRSPRVLPDDLDNAANGGGVALWRNVGAGRFEEVTGRAGLARFSGWTLDVGHGDFDNDANEDIYAAADFGTDRLFFNNGDGTFRDATERSIGFDTKKGMNVEVADYDNDERLDIYVTNVTDENFRECNMLWHNNGDRTFTDVSKETGTCSTLWGWAAKFGDFDNDGWPDLFAVNGLRSAGPDSYLPVLLPMITTPNIDFSNLANWPPLGNRSWSGYQKKTLFRNLGSGQFRDVAEAAGVDNALDGRGIAVADFDNDGRLDLYQTNVDQPALLYHNTTDRVGNWIELKLIGSRSNRDAIGARVTVSAAGRRYLREIDGGNGYAGQSTTRVHVGIGSATRVDDVGIRWPSGLFEHASAEINRITVIREHEERSTK